LGRRLKVLLNAAGIRLIWHAVGEEPVRVEAGALRARLMALPLYCDEPWLRALELASWAGESARVAALTDVEAMPLGSAGRRQAALALESALLSEGLVVPLWTERVGLAVAPGIRGVGPRLRGLAPVLREAAWSGGLRP
jgi:hypothetical protein